MQVIKNSKVKEELYIEKLENGLTVMIIPKKETIKKYVIWGTNFGSIDNHFIIKQNKEEVQTDKLGKGYVLTTTKVARNVRTQLQKELSLLDDKDTKETSIEIADAIYKILVETNYTTLEKIKDNYDVWSDLNEKFNS